MKERKLLLILLGLALIAAPVMAGVFTWDGDGDGESWDDGFNWNALRCYGEGCYPHYDSDDVVIEVSSATDIYMISEEIDSLEVQGTVDFIGTGSEELTMNSIIIAGGNTATTTVSIDDATIVRE